MKKVKEIYKYKILQPVGHFKAKLKKAKNI